MYKIYQIINDEDTVARIAKELVVIFVKKGSNANMDYHFDLSEGQMQGKKRNTFFSCDVNPGTFLETFKEAAFNEDLKGISEKEELQLQKDIASYMQKVCVDITENYSIELRKKIRNIVLPDSDEFAIPLTTIQVQDVDVMDCTPIPEPTRYLLKIGKNEGVSLDTKDITEFVYTQQEKTGKTVEQIFQKEKNKNPLFEKVESLEQGEKYMYEVNMVMFVDYSLNPDAAPETV
jgi:hypothetical protein